MPIDMTPYLQASHPTSLIDLMDERALGHLLDGFAYRLKAGASIIYSEALPASDKTLRQRNFMHDQRFASEVAHPFCRRYRQEPAHDGEQNKRCEQWDLSVALKYYEGEWDGPRLYRCHLQLWDMTYPLRVNQNLLGVLFAGQIILSGENESNAAHLNGLNPPMPMEWPRTLTENQRRDVLNVLPLRAFAESLPTLREFLEQPTEAIEVNSETLVKRYNDFLGFGQTVELLLRSFHNLRVESAERQLVHSVTKELTLATNSRDEWWGAVASVCRELEESGVIGAASIYYREGSRYVEKIRLGQMVASHAALRFPAHLGFDLPVEEPVPADDPAASTILHRIGIRHDWLFRYDSEDVVDHGFSVMFGLQGQPREFAEEFCLTLAIRAQIAELLFRAREGQQAFQERVRNISHSAKTPLMVATTEIRRARKSLSLGQEDDAARNIDGAVQGIRDATAEFAQLYGALPQARTMCDLREVLRASVESVRPLAEAKRCRMVLNAPSQPVSCRVCVPEVNVAIRNLLDNAIKYSFHDAEIRMDVRITPAGKAEISLSNYGVGFPNDRMDGIMREGGRGEIWDPVRPDSRPGTGLGVPISLGILQRHGGTLDLDCRTTRKTEPGTWLHCVTRAVVTLPLSGKLGCL